MRLIYNPLGISMDICMNQCNILVIENHHEFEKFVLRLDMQLQGIEEYILVDDEKYLFSKKATMITSPFDLYLSEREVQKKLYAYLVEEADQSSVTEHLAYAHAKYLQALEQLCVYSDFEIEFNEEFSVNTVLKNMGVCLKKTEGDFCEKFISYGEKMKTLLDKNFFILCNCEAYLNDEDYYYIAQWAGYNEITIMYLRNAQILFPKDCNEYIIDKDLCEIH